MASGAAVWAVTASSDEDGNPQGRVTQRTGSSWRTRAREIFTVEGIMQRSPTNFPIPDRLASLLTILQIHLHISGTPIVSAGAAK